MLVWCLKYVVNFLQIHVYLVNVNEVLGWNDTGTFNVTNSLEHFAQLYDATWQMLISSEVVHYYRYLFSCCVTVW